MKPHPRYDAEAVRRAERAALERLAPVAPGAYFTPTRADYLAAASECLDFALEFADVLPDDARWHREMGERLRELAAAER